MKQPLFSTSYAPRDGESTLDEIEILFETITNNNVAGAIAMTGIVAVSFIVVAVTATTAANTVFAFVFTVVIAVLAFFAIFSVSLIAANFSVALAGDIAFNSAITFTVPSAITVATIIIASVFGFADDQVVAFADDVATVDQVVVFAAAVAGIGFWYRAKNKPDSRRFFAALAFPFFCWLPITVCYSTLAFLNFLSGWQVASLWGEIVLPCTLLWFYGQHKDYQARNPLQGIPELEKYRREPR